jgi:membrane-bound ClpP family serine protease
MIFIINILPAMAKKKIEQEGPDFPLQKDNYILLIIGFAIIMIGFLLMMGGKSDDPNVFNPEIFSFRRITLAPIVVLFGFVFEIWAIMKKPKTEKQD